MAETPMSDEELAIILAAEERAAASFRDTTLADEQANAIDYYEAEPFGDEEEGRSQVVVPDVAEVVDYMQISVLRTCISGDRVVEFEPADADDAPEDEEQFAAFDKALTKAAEDATEAVNYIFMRRQNGYRVLLDWLQSGLIEKIGIVKTACVTKRRKTKQRMVVDEMGLAQLAEQGVEPSAATDNGDGTWLVEITSEREAKTYPDYPVPSEEYLFSSRTKDEDSADYQAQRSRKSKSDLVEMGFDREVVESLPAEDSLLDLDQRSNARWDDESNLSTHATPAMRKVWLLEEYIRLDRDDDGIAELLKVFRVGDVILEVEEVEEQPFVVWTPFPRAHRLVGNSSAEKVMDIQRVSSVLLRQALDGVYQTNNPRMGVDMSGVTDDTLDDLLTVRPGGIVRYKGTKPEPLYESFDIQRSLGMLEYMTGARESRTGITRLNQGLDEDTLNKTASGQASLQALGQQMEEFVARNFAEAMARLFAKKLRLMRDHGDKMAIKVDGAFRRIDPSAWDREMNVAVRVGLGSGRKDQRLVYRRELLGIQREGMDIGLVDKRRLYNNASAMVRDSGLGNPSDYFIDPDSQEGRHIDQQPPQPSPEQMKAQADAEAQKAKLEMDAQKGQADLVLRQQNAAATMDLNREEAAAKLELAREQSAAQIELMRDKAAEEASLARDKAQFEMNMAIQQADREFELSKLRAANDAQIAQQKIPKNRPGGDLDK